MTNGNDTLSKDEPTPVDGDSEDRSKPKITDVSYKIEQQRHSHQRMLFFFSLAFVVGMTAAFVGFCFKVLEIANASLGAMAKLTAEALSSKPSASVLPDLMVQAGGGMLALDWHVLMLGSGLIIPPTIVFWGLIRTIMEPDGNKKRDRLRNNYPEDIFAQFMKTFLRSS